MNTHLPMGMHIYDTHWHRKDELLTAYAEISHTPTQTNKNLVYKFFSQNSWQFTVSWTAKPAAILTRGL